MMNKKTVSRLCARILSFILVFLIYVSIFPVPVSTKAANTSSDRVIVGLGDSFSSGEGIEPFYDQNLPIEQKLNSDDWLAHRSEKAWSGQLILNDNDKKVCYLMNTGRYDKNRPIDEVHWYFAASSGAETKHISNEEQVKDYYIKENDKLYNDSEPIKKQIEIFDTIKKNGQKADYVTLTMGGNDVGFTEVVAHVAISSAYILPNKLTDLVCDKLEILEKNTKNDLATAYESIHTAAGDQASIIVAGYPHLFCMVDMNQSPIGQLFSIGERRFINQCVDIVNDTLKQIVNSKKSEMDIHFVDVTKEFDGHGAYSLNPYINPVYLFPKVQDLDYRLKNEKGINTSSYSIHPNEKGAEAYARCVQTKIDELEKRNSSDNSSDNSSAIVPIETTKPNTTRPNNNIILTTSPGLIPHQKDFPNTTNWQTAAVDLICNAPDYGFDSEYADTVAIELIDITNDDIPEIFFASQMGTSSIGTVSHYFYFNGSRYVTGSMTGDIGGFPIQPHNNGQTVFLTHFIDDDQLSDELPFKLEYWYDELMVSQVTASGSNLNLTKIADYTEDLEPIFTQYNGNEEEPQVLEIWNQFREDANQFKTSYPYDWYYSYTVKYLYPFSGDSSYNVSTSDAQDIVDAYVNAI